MVKQQACVLITDRIMFVYRESQSLPRPIAVPHASLFHHNPLLMFIHVSCRPIVSAVSFFCESPGGEPGIDPALYPAQISRNQNRYASE